MKGDGENVTTREQRQLAAVAGNASCKRHDEPNSSFVATI